MTSTQKLPLIRAYAIADAVVDWITSLAEEYNVEFDKVKITEVVREDEENYQITVFINHPIFPISKTINICLLCK